MADCNGIATGFRVFWTGAEWRIKKFNGATKGWRVVFRGNAVEIIEGLRTRYHADRLSEGARSLYIYLWAKMA